MAIAVIIIILLCLVIATLIANKVQAKRNERNSEDEYEKRYWQGYQTGRMVMPNLSEIPDPGLLKLIEDAEEIMEERVNRVRVNTPEYRAKREDLAQRRIDPDRL